MNDNKVYTIGIWKFSDKAKDEVEQLAREWAKEDKYIQLYIAHKEKGQMALGFVYQVDSIDDHGDYFYNTSDVLKRRFGNDLLGWDVSTTDQLLKGF
jgi:hypothetical protein